MKNFQKLRTALFLPTIGASLFIIFTGIAMLFYPGGSAFDENAHGYSFFDNFFSDLGLITAYSGESNLISSILFLFATISIGLSMITHFFAFPYLFSRNSLQKVLVIFGSALGIISAIAYIGIGFTPWDKYLTAHFIFVYIAFPLTLPVIFLFVSAIMLEKNLPNKLAYIYICLGIILIGYLYLLFFGPKSGTELGRIIQVVGQKIIVYAENITFFFQGLTTRKYLTLQDTQ